MQCSACPCIFTATQPERMWKNIGGRRSCRSATASDFRIEGEMRLNLTLQFWPFLNLLFPQGCPIEAAFENVVVLISSFIVATVSPARELCPSRKVHSFIIIFQLSVQMLLLEEKNNNNNLKGGHSGLTRSNSPGAGAEEHSADGTPCFP